MLLSVILHASLIKFSSFWMTGLTQQIKSDDNVILNFILELNTPLCHCLFWDILKIGGYVKVAELHCCFWPCMFYFLSFCPDHNHFQVVSETAINIGLYPKAATGCNPYGHFVIFMIRLVRLIVPPKSDLSERREKNKIPWWFLPADWIKAACLHDEWPLKWNILISNGHK